MTSNRFWPFGDPEGEIYDSPAWDLPGLRPKLPASKHNPPKPGSRLQRHKKARNPGELK